MAASLPSIFIRFSPSSIPLKIGFRCILTTISSYTKGDQAIVRTSEAKMNDEWKKRNADAPAARRLGKMV